MPNWNYATIYLTGDKKVLDEIYKTGFDFNKLRPMPKEFSDDVKSNKNLGGLMWKADMEKPKEEDYLKRAKTNKEKEDLKKLYDETVENWKTVMRWIKEYGTNGWYEWSNRNWGTKWNPFPEHVTLERESDIKIKVDLQTAWCLPMQLLTHITKKYPIQILGTTQEETEHNAEPFVIEKGEIRG